MTDLARADAPVPGQLVVASRKYGDAVVLELQGELDLTSAPVFEQELKNAGAGGPARLVIDLAGLEFMDSTGLRALLLARERADADGYALALRRGPRQVQRVLELTRTVDAFRFED